VLSASNPRIVKEAVEVEVDVFCKLNGDWSGRSGVHSWLVAGTGFEQPADPSIPALRTVNVKEMFGAASNIIKSATAGKLPGGVVTSGGFAILSISPVVPFNAIKPPCCEEAGEFMRKSLPTNETAPRDMLAVPVIFSTPVIKLACAAKGMPTSARILSVKMLFVIGSGSFLGLTFISLMPFCRKDKPQKAPATKIL
jgi:hypothetical protein